jgi:hypothetical protein
MKNRFIVHPALMGLIPVLFVYAHNVSQARLKDVVVPLLASLALALILWGILGLIVRNARVSALMTSLMLLLFHSYGHILMLTEKVVVRNHRLVQARYLLALWVLILAAGIYLLARHRRSPAMGVLTTAANRFCVVMIVLSLIQIGTFHAREGHPTDRDAPAKTGSYTHSLPIPPISTGENLDPAHGGAAPSSLPDIYYIIPDSYEANVSLMREFGYDNSDFTDFLEDKGFVVAPNSASNYAFTAPSLTSSLNMEYLSSFPELPDRESRDMTALGARMANNRVMSYLKSKGYTVINAGSWLGSTYADQTADINLRADHLTEFAVTVLKGTVLFPFSEELLMNSFRNKTLFVLDNLAEIPKLPAPTFTLAHMVCPHPPYVFDASGGKVPARARVLATSNTRKLYLDQLKFMNIMLRAAVDTILARSPTPPIIIIQGDHGAAYTATRPIFVNTVPGKEYASEQMRILNAYYLPGAPRETVYDSISPVNTFRAIFNAYFDAGLPLLEDRNYLSNRIRPYAFVDVTDLVKRGR